MRLVAAETAFLTSRGKLRARARERRDGLLRLMDRDALSLAYDVLTSAAARVSHFAGKLGADGAPLAHPQKPGAGAVPPPADAPSRRPQRFLSAAGVARSPANHVGD